MASFLGNPTFLIYGQLFLGAVFNLLAMFFVKKSEGFSHALPVLGAIITVTMTQWLLSRVMTAGVDVGLGVAMLSVFVLIGSVLIGIFAFSEPISILKMSGLVVAAMGVFIASMAKS